MKLTKDTESYVVIQSKNQPNQRPYFCFIKYKYSWGEYIFTSDGISGFPIGDTQEILKYYGKMRVMENSLSDYQDRKYRQWRRQYHKDFPWPHGEFTKEDEGILSPAGIFYPGRYGDHHAIAENLFYRFHKKSSNDHNKQDDLKRRGYLFWHPKSEHTLGFFTGITPATEFQKVRINLYDLEYYPF